MKQFIYVKIQLAFCLMMLIPMLGISQSKSTSASRQAPYPQLKSTGNPEFDKQQHAKAVKIWQEGEKLRLETQKKTANVPVNVSTNVVPSKQKASLGTASVYSSQRISKGQQREISFTDIPGYPKFIATGNSELDNKNYQKAKAKWMDENPDAYQKYIKEHSGKTGNAKRLPVGQ
jgi:hypothetical protein